MQTSDKLIRAIKDYYLTSDDYNGLPASSLASLGLSETEIKQEIASLVTDELVGILSSSFDENPYINRLGFPDIEVQLAELQSAFNGCFIYPTPSLMKEQFHTESTTPMEQHLRIGQPQLKAMFFEYDILLSYFIDPRFNFNFHDYSGSITSTDKVDERRYIHLDTFGIGRDSDKLVIVAFPRYLRKMSPANQMLWEAHRIIDTSQCKVLKDYLDNEFNGSWNFPCTVYRSILYEIENVNILCENIFGIKFFQRTYKKDELDGFEMLPLPTMQLYNDFLLLLEKITVGNINDKFFDGKIDQVKDINGNRKGSLACLSEWLDIICPMGKDLICEPLKLVRTKRQAPAHKIQTNRYEPNLLNEQHEICKAVHESLNSLRKLLTSHPLAKEVNIPHRETEYIVV